MKILMIGAHQDDAEFRCGGTAYKLAQLGHRVRFLSMTNGCGGHHILSAEETVAVRAKESAAVAKLLGIEYEIWKDQADCALLADLTTRRRLIRDIRRFAPDIVIAHRPNDYHADHRASAQLVMDASYMLVVPHECPDVPAMKNMPVIMYYEDGFTEPAFRCDFIVGIDEVIDTKLQIAHLNVSQVYEWLPYTNGETVPAGEKERFEWLKGMDTDKAYTDEEILSLPRGYAVRFAKPAAKFRDKLTEKYGKEKGAKIRYAEAFALCQYGAPLTAEAAALFAAL
ncbi:MAG: PIG-L family deacetylase [Clostridia bacterium]|nr:PIG-L family deacetylase [Clostridia bacterium]